jgi:hypothetical protein
MKKLINYGFICKAGEKGLRWGTELMMAEGQDTLCSPKVGG